MEEKDSAAISSVECGKWKFINNSCRLCSLECNSNSRSILQKKILEMLQYCSFLYPSKTDELPKLICTSCYESLTRCYLFKKKIEATDLLLKKQYEELNPKQNILDIALNKAEIKCSQMVPKTIIDENVSSRGSKNDLSLVCMSLNHTSVPWEGDNSNCSITSQQVTTDTHIIAAKHLKHEENVDLPPLVPINLTESPDKKILSQVIPQEPPPLVPLKPISIEEQSSTNSSMEQTSVADNLKKHHTECEIPKSLICNICKKEFSDGKKLIGHLKGHMVPKNFVCKICNKKYPNPSTFEIHMRSHTGERPFKCPVCNKGFTRWAGVVSHMQTHEENRPFKCDSCEQSFKILSNLERHKVLHSGVLPFCCNYCGKTFSQSANLQLHIRTYHTNERPYLCSECGKGFVSSTRLNRHMFIHTGYKPFPCEICSKSYSNSSDLKMHVKSAHGDDESDKKYVCDLCDKRFFYLCRLNKHLKMHRRRYTCIYCHKVFRSNSLLDQHKENKHSYITQTKNQDARIKEENDIFAKMD